MRTIELNPKYEHLRPFISQIPERMDTDGTYIYGGRRNLIKLFEAPDGTRLNVKRYQIPSFLNNIIYSTGIRQPKGRRAYTYPAILLQRGIETPEAVAYIEDRRMGLLRHSWFISIQCPYSHLLYEMGDATESDYAPVAHALAAYAAHMHQQEVLHLDFSPGNVLWDVEHALDDCLAGDKSQVPDIYHFAVVDINRMRFGTVSMADGCRSFARLWGPKHFMELLIADYARLRGFDIDTSTDILMAERRRFWTRYQKKREMEFKLEL
ncbi:MAG: aminoglycoside phosphotransferase [Prevotella sp.]|nr:aminoglycoside phosphotransferase [Prevotella sp.]